jgi:predicted phage terminase large subunit-like protein
VSTAIAEAQALATYRIRQRQAHEAVKPRWQPLPHQSPPPGDWRIWMIIGGRGSGKTRGGSEYVLHHLRTIGRRARVGVGAPTIGAVRKVCAEGESGLITIAPEEFVYNRSLLQARHRNGGLVDFMGAEEPNRWNGPQWTLLWPDELALWSEESWKQARLGLRLPPDPRAVVTTTPKASKFVRELEGKPGVVVTRATMFDNPYLAPSAVAELKDAYGDTRLGRQELLGEWIDDVPGALWTHGQLDALRVTEASDMVRVVVAIDPAVTSGETSDETGIIVAGKGDDGHAYVLADVTCRMSPDGWARRAVNAYHRWEASRIVAEVNNGGEMVEQTLRTVEPSIPYTAVHATRGKRTRAEPIAALYEQHKVHHVGMFPQLEDQQCQYTPDGYDGSPDRVDALVWALTELMLGGEPAARYLGSSGERDRERVSSW